KDSEIQTLLKDYNFNKQTSNTISSKKEFLKEIKKVRNIKYAVDYEENEVGVICLAVPVKNHANESIAAISISLPASVNINDKIIESYASILSETSREISSQMGYKHHVFN